MTHSTLKEHRCRTLSTSAVIAGLLTTPLVAILSTVQAAFSGYNGKIAFHSYRDGDAEIFVMDDDGNNVTQLTGNSTNDANPVWSPDGSSIAFQSIRDGDYEIYIMNTDGASQIRLTNATGSDGNSQWSPDGSKIVFTSNRDGNQEIYLMDSDGANQIRLTSNSSIDNYPRWSPSGDRISFVSTRDGNGEIYIMDSDGTNQIRLTNTLTGNSGGASWSADGSKLTFNTDRSGHVADPEIYTMSNDGSDQERLTFSAGGDYSPEWQSISNKAPITAPDTLITPYNNALNADVLTNDTDEEVLNSQYLTIVTPPLNGTAGIVSGKVEYTPNSGYIGSDQLAYQICDSFLLDQKCATGVLSVTVQAPGAPVLTVDNIGGDSYQNGTASYSTTNSRPTFAGTATPGADIKVEIHSDPIVLTTTANDAGEWSVTPDQDIPYGEHTVTITATKDGATTTLEGFVLSITAGAPGIEVPNTGANTIMLRNWGITLLAAGSLVHLTRRRRTHRPIAALPPLFPHH